MRSRGWIIAASIAAVEAMKDQGICRWNYSLRSFQQHAKNNVLRSLSHESPNKFSSSLISRTHHEKAKQSEESMRKVIYLSCWGPN